MSSRSPFTGAMHIIIGTGIIGAAAFMGFVGSKNENSGLKDLQVKEQKREIRQIYQALLNHSRSLEDIYQAQKLHSDSLHDIYAVQSQYGNALSEVYRIQADFCAVNHDADSVLLKQIQSGMKISLAARETFPQYIKAVRDLKIAIKPVKTTIDDIANWQNRKGALNAPLREIGKSFSGMQLGMNNMFISLDNAGTAAESIYNIQQKEILPSLEENIRKIQQARLKEEQISKNIIARQKEWNSLFQKIEKNNSQLKNDLFSRTRKHYEQNMIYINSLRSRIAAIEKSRTEMNMAVPAGGKFANNSVAKGKAAIAAADAYIDSLKKQLAAVEASQKDFAALLKANSLDIRMQLEKNISSLNAGSNELASLINAEKKVNKDAQIIWFCQLIVMALAGFGFFLNGINLCTKKG